MVELLTFIFVNLLGTMSPGPDFAIVTRYGLTGSRRSALFATLGIAAALIVHVLYCILGIALLIQSSPTLFSLLQLGGSLYLGYLAIGLIRGSKKKQPQQLDAKVASKQAFRDGFLTNLLNPKATIFLLSIISRFIAPDTSFGMKIAFGATIPFVALSWFALVSYLLTHKQFFPLLERHQRKFTLSMGLILLFLSASFFYQVIYKFFVHN